MSLACAILGARSLRAQPAPTLTARDIEDAIQWGVSGAPGPYSLTHMNTDVRNGTPPVIVAVVYTPFVRVALAAKAARDKGEDFTPTDVQNSWVEPIVHVAFRWPCCLDPDHGTDRATWNPFKPPVDYKIAVPGDRITQMDRQLIVTASPLWVTHDTSLVARFGGALPYNDVVVIAGYPVGALAASPDFVIYREAPSATVPGTMDTTLVVGRVTSDDLARWR